MLSIGLITQLPNPAEDIDDDDPDDAPVVIKGEPCRKPSSASGVEVAGYFVDTSALVKRYVQEVGTPWVRSLTRGNTLNRIYLARITAVEITAAIARRRKGRTLTSPRASSILYRFRKHLVGRYTIVEVTPDLLTEAMKLANSYELRAYDAVQLAVAIEVNRIYQTKGSGPVILVSSDRDLNAAATAEGLAVEDPTTHP